MTAPRTLAGWLTLIVAAALLAYVTLTADTPAGHSRGFPPLDAYLVLAAAVRREEGRDFDGNGTPLTLDPYTVTTSPDAGSATVEGLDCPPDYVPDFVGALAAGPR